MGGIAPGIDADGFDAAGTSGIQPSGLRRARRELSADLELESGERGLAPLPGAKRGCAPKHKKRPHLTPNWLRLAGVSEAELVVPVEVDGGAVHVVQGFVDVPVRSVTPAAGAAVIFFAAEVGAGFA